MHLLSRLRHLSGGAQSAQQGPSLLARCESLWDAFLAHERLAVVLEHVRFLQSVESVAVRVMLLDHVKVFVHFRRLRVIGDSLVVIKIGAALVVHMTSRADRAGLVAALGVLVVGTVTARGAALSPACLGREEKLPVTFTDGVPHIEADLVGPRAQV